MEQTSRKQILGGLLHRIRNYHSRSFATEFSERLILQKTIYLMQTFDLFIGYHFNWYLKGPYSPQLAKDAYDLSNTYEELPEVTFVSVSAEKRFQKFMSLVGDHLMDADWLEAIASIHYLYHRGSAKDRDSIFVTIKNKMPSLKKSDFDSYWKILSETGMIGD